MTERRDELADALTREEGKTLVESRGEIQRAINVVEFFAGEARRMLGETIPSELPFNFCYTVREPVGPVALITPWNFPVAIPVWKLAPAIVCGNPVVLKPASLTPLCAALVAEIFAECDTPPGVLNVVYGSGREVGAALLAHPAIKGVSFTGSNDVGTRLSSAGASRGIKCQCEIGNLPAIALGIALCLGWGCAATGGSRPIVYEYFSIPHPDDAWSRKIELWQARERAEGLDQANAVLAPVAEGFKSEAATASQPRGEPGSLAASASPPLGNLREKFEAFRTGHKRALANDVAEWIQMQARDYYVADGPLDHWATLEDTFRSNGDDCDGLELLVYHLLRDLGFRSDEVFRAIVYRRSDGQHHMVTLWFEDAADPWVIDPTGAMTFGMPRMSALPEWTPLKVFTEDEDFTVQPHRVARN